MRNKIVILIITVTMICALSGMAIAGTPPSIPQKSTGGSDSGGGGGGGGTYTPPEFKPYSVSLQTTDAGVNGTISVKSFTLASLLAEKTMQTGNGNTTMRLAMDLDSAPSSPRLDVVPLDVASVTTPLDADLFSSILAFNLSRSSAGGEWPMKKGTVQMTLIVPLDQLNAIDLNSSFYLVKDDGTSTILYDAVPVIENGMVKFTLPLWYETSSPSPGGTFTLAGGKAQSALPTATPAPTATSTPTPTPKSGSGLVVLSLIAALGIATVFLSRGKKQ